MNIFIDTTATREYTLPSEPSIIWTLGALDSRLVLHIFGKTYGSTAPDAEQFFAKLVDFVRFGLVKAKDAATGEAMEIPTEEVDVPFVGKRTAIAESFLKRVRPDVLMTLGREIMKDNILTDEERKNSSALLVSSETPGS